LQEYVGADGVNVSTIDKRGQSCWFDFGKPHMKKGLNKFFIVLKKTGLLDLTINFRKDYDNEIVAVETINELQAPSVYDSAIYDTSLYSSDETIIKLLDPNIGPFYSLQLEFASDNKQATFQVVNYGFEVEELDPY
jgi:hypothetical protein